MMDLTRLRLLRELAHRGTMTAVATAFGLTSSAVSQQLAVLEREARVVLLERVGRRVLLTAEGRRLAAHAETILEAVEAAELDLTAAGNAPRGVIEIGSFPSFAKAQLLPAVVRTRKRFPELRIVIHELEPPDAIEALRNGRCDLAVSFAYNFAPRPDIAGLVAQQSMEEPMLLALPPRWRRAADPVALDRLAGRACAVAGFAPRITHTIDDYDLVLRMVAAGLGVGFVPELALQGADAKAVVIRRPAGAVLSRRIHLLTRRALAASPLVRALLSELPRAG